MMVLFDFKAVFPSIDHNFMWRALRGAGMVEEWVQLIQTFCVDNEQILGGNGVYSFQARVGIRQGCPLSPIMFALVADFLLRRIRREVGGGGEVRAVADDTAVATKDAPTLRRVLASFQSDWKVLVGRMGTMESNTMLALN